MSALTPDDFPALGFIPCPGDLEATEAIQSAFSDTAGRLEEVCAVLTGADEGAWRGETAIAFREVLDDELRPKIEDAHQSFSDATRALADWVDRMRTDQLAADDLEVDAAAALADAQAAQSVVEGLPPDTRGEDPPEDETGEERQQREDDQEARETAEQDVRVAEAALREFRDRAELLQREYNDFGEEVSERLRDAMDIAPNEPGIFGQIAEGIAGIVDGLMDALADLGDMVIAFLGEIAPILAVFNTIMGLVVTVLSIAAILFPVLAPVLGPLAFGLGCVVLLTTYAQKVGETGSFVEALKSPSVWAAAAGVVLGGASLAVSRLTAPAMQTAEGLSTLSNVMRPTAAYLNTGTNALRVENSLANATVGVETFNTLLNREGNHLSNYTGIGLGTNIGPFSIGDDERGWFSGDEAYDNTHHSDQERQAGALGTNSDDYAIGEPT